MVVNSSAWGKQRVELPLNGFQHIYMKKQDGQIDSTFELRHVDYSGGWLDEELVEIKPGEKYQETPAWGQPLNFPVKSAQNSAQRQSSPARLLGNPHWPAEGSC